MNVMLFILATRTYTYSKNPIILHMGTAYLAVAILGAMHVLSYKGMDLIPNIDSSMATQFWVARRSVEMGGLFIATFIVKREQSPCRLLAVWLGVAGLLTLSIFTRVFPVCFVEGAGLTPFKIISEYVIILLGIGALLRLKKFSEHFETVYVKVIAWAIVFGILAEFMFTLYSTVYDVFNGIGHILYLCSSGLLLVFVVKEGLDKPYSIMFKALYDRSIRDLLTGVFNRQGLETMSHNAFERAKRFPSAFCLLMMDLDNFKSVNDEYGHPEGDRTLVEFAEILTSTFREYDIIARLGGDEFVALLEYAPDATMDVETRLRMAVERWKDENPRHSSLGLSIGKALREPGSDLSLAVLLQQADAELLHEKSTKHISRRAVAYALPF
jgi:diguanylate cyclase (GGDEF)-like protein